MENDEKLSTPQPPKRKRMTREEREAQIRRRVLLTAAAFAALILIVILIAAACSRRQKSPGPAVSEAAAPSVQTDDTVGTEALTEAMTEAVTETEPDPYSDKPDIDINSWEYILANPTHSIGDYAPSTAQIEDIELDARIVDAMNAFVNDTRAQGLNVVLTSGYRSYDTQTWLFQNKVSQYGGDEETAATIVARPGTSEHQTGLAADITDQYYEYMNESLEDTATYQWMSAHCQDYGFIVRFPKGRQDVTGIIYEPWHYRYVGKEAAAYIMSHDLTLEEFIELYQ